MGPKCPSRAHEAHDLPVNLTFSLDPRAAYYNALMPQDDDRYAYASTSSMRMRFTSAATPSTPPLLQEARESNSSTSALGVRPKGVGSWSTAMSKGTTDPDVSVAPLSIQPKSAAAPSTSSSTSQERKGPESPTCVPRRRSERESAPPIMLRGGRDQETPPAVRIRPKGPRAPSLSSLDFRRSSFIAPAADTAVSPPPVDTPKRLLLTPSQLRFQLQTPITVFAEDQISPHTSATVSRTPHIRRRVPKISLRPIIVDLSLPESQLSQQSTQPLPVALSMDESSIYSLSPSSPKETQTPRDSPVEWQDSPGSTYSTNLSRSTSIYVEWDDTGYLAEDCAHENVWNEPSKFTAQDNLEDAEPPKRQNTEAIKDLLRQRRRRAGLEE